MEIFSDDSLLFFCLEIKVYRNEKTFIYSLENSFEQKEKGILLFVLMDRIFAS
jgi:hypothetical protein